jgi:hypothetical protein
MLEVCERPFGPDVIVVDGLPTERDYLYAVWYRLGKYLGWEMPMLPPPDNRSEVEMLREEIHRLVAEHQAANYPIQPTFTSTSVPQ